MALMIRSVPDTGDSSESLYHYEPSLAVAIVAAAFYGVAFLLTLVQWARYKSWVWLTMVVASASKSYHIPRPILLPRGERFHQHE